MSLYAFPPKGALDYEVDSPRLRLHGSFFMQGRDLRILPHLTQSQ